MTSRYDKLLQSFTALQNQSYADQSTIRQLKEDNEKLSRALQDTSTAKVPVLEARLATVQEDLLKSVEELNVTKQRLRDIMTTDAFSQVRCILKTLLPSFCHVNVHVHMNDNMRQPLMSRVQVVKLRAQLEAEEAAHDDTQCKVCCCLPSH